MSDRNNELKKEILYYAKLMDEKGMVNTLEGNLSILDRETGKMYITPSGTRKRFLNEDKIAVVNTENGEQIEGTVKRSSEILLHEAALKARPDCNAAAHIHAPYLTAYAYCGKDIKLNVPLHFHWYSKKSHAFLMDCLEQFISQMGLKMLSKTMI